MPNYYTQVSFEITDLTDEEMRWLKDELEKAEDEGYLEFHADDDKRLVWIYSEEAAYVEAIADVCEEFLHKFRPTEQIAFEWANTASKPLDDAYGGGAVVVTAHKTYLMSSGLWLSNKLASLQQGWLRWYVIRPINNNAKNLMRRLGVCN